MSTMPPTRGSFLTILFVSALGCSSSNSNVLAPEAQTLLGVNAADFMAAGSCGVTVQVYVATLRDMTGADNVDLSLVNLSTSSAPFVVGSSAPTPCDESIVFSNVIVSHAYEVDLDGYNRSDILPVNLGASVMFAGSQYVAPRWTAACHGWTDADGGVQPGLAYPNMTVTLRDCTELGEPNR